jgi:hypothetical protein
MTQASGAAAEGQRGKQKGAAVTASCHGAGERRRGRSGVLRGGAEQRAEQSAAGRSKSFRSRREKEEEEN